MKIYYFRDNLATQSGITITIQDECIHTYILSCIACICHYHCRHRIIWYGMDGRYSIVRKITDGLEPCFLLMTAHIQKLQSYVSIIFYGVPTKVVVISTFAQ